MAEETAKRPHKSLIRRYLITGLIAWAPVGVTLFFIRFFAEYLGGLVNLLPLAWQPQTLIGHDIPGLSALLGISIVLMVLFITGFIASNVLGRYLLGLGDELLEHIPLVRSIYSTVKQISDTMFSNKGKSFRKVVLIRYPQKDTWSLAFQTSDTLGELNAKVPGHNMISVYVPTTPNPTSGFLLMVPPGDVIELEMSVDEAFKMIISLGVIVPPFPRPVSGKTTPGLARVKREP
ncbi:MAG: DUF502 domain-containing protein [Gammaproteobacteria bacterium]